MCGIAGVFANDRHHEPSEKLLADMIQSLVHRGPDAQQTWINPGIGLAHARLSIIDLHASANQPMKDGQTGNIIVFNGEIYNYIELKDELLALGHVFHTQSDTEVILKAWTQWGVDCLNKFNGMWAFALYDQTKKTLFCSRDRMGIKPFVYGIGQKNELVFASEAKAISHHFPEFRQINTHFMTQFVERDFFACYKETFNKNVFNLLPGHYFMIKHGETPVQKRYWSWTPTVATRLTKKDDADLVDQFKTLLCDSIALRFRSDVPVGSCLSGGMDSSVIVGLASQMFGKRVHTFSCVYPNNPEYDESSYIRASVEKFNTIPKYVEPRHDDFIQLVYSSIHEQDGPTGGPSVLSQRAVMELVSEDVKVVLDGQGADELLGGYHSYFRYSLLARARAIWNRKHPGELFNYLSSASKIKNRTGKKSEGLARHLYLTRSPTRFYSPNIQDTQLHYMQEFADDDLNTVLLEHMFTNITNLLHYEDRNSMRFSIESRLPFLDYRLIEFAFSLPHQYKIRGSTTKWLLHSVAKDILPTQVLNRKDKMGYSTPAHQWFLQDTNLQFFKQYLHQDNPVLVNLSPFMRDYLLSSFKTLTQNGGGTADINALWRFFTANMWCEGG